MTKLTSKARNAMPAAKYAFTKARKEPLENAAHVRNAIARFGQVKGVTDAERQTAWARIRRAARKFGVDVHKSGGTHRAG